MKSRNPILAAVALTLSAGALSATQPSADVTASANLIVSKLIGLSPEGTRLWASHVVAGSDYDRFKRSSQLHQAIGEQLALDRPSRSVLTRLMGEIVQEARLEKMEQGDS